MPPTDLPSNLTYGRIVGRFLTAVADTTGDVDTNPDGVAPSGIITFVPTPSYVLDATATPDPVTVLPKPITCTLDASGYLIDPTGARGVSLVATDDTALNPTGWTYSVTINIDGSNLIRSNILVPGGSTQDLTTLIPVPSSGGTPTLVGPVGPTGPTGPTGPAGPIHTVVGSSGPDITGAQIAADAALKSTYVGLPSGGLADYAVLAKLAAGTNGIQWTTKEELVARALGWFIITDARYGAVGDSATDNTTAIQAAITAASGTFASGAVVYIPPASGDYLFSNLTVPAGVSLVGAGWSLRANAAFGSSLFNVGAANAPKGCVLRSTATSGTAISFSSTTTQNRSREFLVMGPGSGTSTGVQFSSATSSTKHVLSDIMVANFQTCWDMGIVEDSTFIHLSAKACATGFKLGAACNQNVWLNTEVQFSSSNGIYNNGGTKNHFVGGLLQNTSGNASLYHVSGEANTYEGFYHEASALPSSSIQLDAGSNNAFRDWWVSNPVGSITFNGGASNTLENFDGGAALSFVANGGSGRLIDVKAVTISGTAANNFEVMGGDSSGNGWKLGPSAPLRVQSGNPVYLETTGTNSYIKRDGSTGDTVIGGATGIIRPGTSSTCFVTGTGATGSRPSASSRGAGAYWYDTTIAGPIFSNGTSWVAAQMAAIDTTAADFQMDGTASAGSTGKLADAGHVHPTDTSRAPLASPAFTGTPTAPTPTAGTNTTQVATTAFVQGAVTGTYVPLVPSGNIKTGNGTYTVPGSGTVVMRITAVGGGAGGCGGGSALTSGGISNQVGGGAGGAGGSTVWVGTVTAGTVLTHTIGAGGTGGNGGAANSNAGTVGAVGGNTTVTGTGVSVTAQGGGGGTAGGANSATQVGGGFGGTAHAASGAGSTTLPLPGAGGSAANSVGLAYQPGFTSFGQTGGGGGGPANGTNGGLGGPAGALGGLNTTTGVGGSGTSSGGNGSAAAANTGCGGGGGGGGAPGGAGGNGGAGGSGWVLYEVIG